MAEQIYPQCGLYCALYPTDDVPVRFYSPDTDDDEPVHLHGPVNFTKAETTLIEPESDDLIAKMASSVGVLLASMQKATNF